MATLQQITDKRKELMQTGKYANEKDAMVAARQQLTNTTPVQNPPVVPPQQTTPPQTIAGVNGEQFKVAPVNQQTGLSQPAPVTTDTTKPIIPVQEIAKSPTEQQINQAREVAKSVTPTTPVKTEAPIDYTQAKGREQDIIKNLDTFKAQGMTPDQIMKASDYANATPEKKALIEPYLKQTQPTASSMFNAIIAKQDIPDEQKISTGYKIAQNRYLKANNYASMSPAQVSQAMTDSKLIEGSQTWEDLKTLNPKLAQDVQNLRIVNGSKQNVFTYVNNPDGTPVKDANGQLVRENNLTKQFSQDYLDDYGDFLRSIYQVQSPDQIRAAIYTDDVRAAEDKANEIELELNAIEKDMNTIDSDVESELAGTGATGSRIRLEKATRAEKLQNLYNSTLKNYTTYANKANNLINQNTAVYKSQQEQQTALQSALAGAAKSKYENELALKQDQAKFEQDLQQTALAAKDPTTAIGNVIDQFSKLGIVPDRDIAWHLQAFKDSGMTLPEYTQKMIENFKAKPQYQAMSAYQMSQYAQKPTTPYQLANLGDGRAIMYNQATGEYQQINASAVNTAAQSPSTIAQYSQQARGKTNLQCGELVNDYWTQFTGGRAGMGDTYQSKIDAINKIGSSTTPQVGGVFVLNTGTSTGHTGIVTGVNGNQITVLEANRAGKKEGEPPVENTYTISDKFKFSNPPSTGAQVSQYTDQNIADLAYLVELQEKNPTQASKDMKELGYTARDIANYKAGNVPLTDKQKQTSTSVIDDIKDLVTNYDWNDATGFHAGMPVIPGTDRADTLQKIDQLVAKMTLPNLGSLKGPMSDKDLAFITKASSNLSAELSDDQFEKNLIQAYNVAARRAGIPEITKLSDIGKTTSTPTNTGAGQISPQDLAELQKLFNQ